MQGGQVPPREVSALYEEMLLSSRGELREILESLDLARLEVRSLEEFRDLLTGELELKGLSEKERRRILSEYFGEGDLRTAPAARKTAWLLPALILVAGSVLIWLLIAWWRRRKRDKQED